MTNSSLNMSGYNFTVTDLDPNDGVTANYTLDSGYQYMAPSSYDHQVRERISDYQPGSPTVPFSSPITSTVGQVTLESNGKFGSMIMTERGNDRLTEGSDLNAYSSVRANFTITPYTKFTMTGHLSMTGLRFGHEVPADTELVVGSLYTVYTQWKSQYSDAYRYPLYTSAGPRAATLEQDLSFDFVNDSPLPRVLTIDQNGETYAYFRSTLVPSVPEPDSYAMLGAGLLLVGALRRRRLVPSPQ